MSRRAGGVSPRLKTPTGGSRRPARQLSMPLFSKEGAAAVTEPAERECPAPSRGNRDGCPVAGALTHAATGLPWLAPAAASLTLLARQPATAWPTVRHDPGALLLLLRSHSS